MKTTTPDCINWKLIENWEVSLAQNLILVDQMILELITSGAARLSATKLKERIEILVEIKAALIAYRDSGLKQM